MAKHKWSANLTELHGGTVFMMRFESTWRIPDAYQCVGHWIFPACPQRLLVKNMCKHDTFLFFDVTWAQGMVNVALGWEIRCLWVPGSVASQRKSHIDPKRRPGRKINPAASKTTIVVNEVWHAAPPCWSRDKKIVGFHVPLFIYIAKVKTGVLAL